MISVIIPTYNGASKLEGCLQSLEKQSYKEFEIIVVVDGSTDETRELLDQTNFDLRNLSIVYQQNSGRSGARNTGCKRAKGDLLIFLDDDMLATEDLVACHKQFHDTYEGILVGVQMEDPALMKTDFQKFKAYLSDKWMSDLGIDFKRLENPFITAANFSIKKRIFQSLGMFCEEITDCEDYDLALKSRDNDIPIYFDPNCKGIHRDFVTADSYVKRLHQYREALSSLKEIYPLRYKDISSGIKRSLFKTIIFGFFSFDIWLYLIDKHYLKVLPKRIRYKIYDLIITSKTSYFTSA